MDEDSKPPEEGFYLRSNRLGMKLQSNIEIIIEGFRLRSNGYISSVEVVTLADVSDEDRVDNSLMHTWELKLGNKAKLLFRL